MNMTEASNFVFPEEYETLNELFNDKHQGTFQRMLEDNPILVNGENIHLRNPIDHFGVFYDPTKRKNVPIPSILGSVDNTNFGGLVGSALLREEDINHIRDRYNNFTDILVTSPSGFGKTHRLLLLGSNNIPSYFSVYVSCGGGMGFSNSFDHVDEFDVFWKHFEEMNDLSDDEQSLYKNTIVGRKKTKEFLIFRLCHLSYLLQRGIVKTPRDFMISQFDRNGRSFLKSLKGKFDRFIETDVDNLGKLESDVIECCEEKGIKVDFMVDEINVLCQRFVAKYFSKYLKDEPGTPPKDPHQSQPVKELRKRTFLYPFLFELSKEIRASSIFQKLFVSGTLLSYNIIEAFVSAVGKRRISQIYFEYDFDVNESFDQVRSNLSDFLSISEESFEEMKLCLQRKDFLEHLFGRKRIVEKIISKIHSKMSSGDVTLFESDKDKGKFLAIAAEEALKEYTKDFIDSFRNDSLTSPHVKALLSLLGNLFHTKQIRLPYRLSVGGKGEYDFMTSAFAQLSQSNQNRMELLPEMETIEWEIIEQVVIDALVSDEIRGNAQISPKWSEKSEIRFLWSFVNEWKKGSMGFLHEEFFIEKFCERWKGASLGEIFNGKISKFSDEGGIERVDNYELSSHYSPLKFDVSDSTLKKHENKMQEIEYLKRGDCDVLPHIFVSPTTFHHCDGLIGIIQDYEEENGNACFFDLRIGLKLGLNMVGIRELRKNICQTSLDSSYCKIVEKNSHYEIGDVLDNHKEAYEEHKKWAKNLDFSIRMHVDLLKYNKRDYRKDITCWNDLHCVGTVEDEDEEKVEVKDSFEEYFVFVDETNIGDFIDEKYLFVFELMRSIRDAVQVNKLKIPRSIIDFLGPRTVGQGHDREMKDEESENMKKKFSFKACIQFAEGPMGGQKELYRAMLVPHEVFGRDLVEGMEENEGDINRYLYKRCQGKNENEFKNYQIYSIGFADIGGIDAVVERDSFSEFYFCTYDQRNSIKKAEEEARKHKEEEEARKHKEEEEARKHKEEEEEEARKHKEELKEDRCVRLYFVDSKDNCEEVFFDVCIDQESDYNGSKVKDAIEKFKEEEDFQKKKKLEEETELFIYDYKVGILNNWVGRKYGQNRPCNSLIGQIMFFVTEDEKKRINEGKIKFRAGSGMSFLDKWFDDDDEEDGKGVVSGNRMKDEDSEDSEWKKEILLECCDGRSIQKNMNDLLQKSRFFRMMISFNGKEAQEAREHGKIKIELLSTLEMEYYLKVIFGMKEEFGSMEGMSGNSRIGLLLRMLEFGMRYHERKVAEKVLTELEMHIIPDLISCGLLDLKLMELGHLFYDRLPNGLLDELLERWCLNFDVRKTSTELRRLIQYSSVVMGKACTFLEEEETDMLDEDAERYDYGVGEVVLGNGKVLDQCFVGKFGGHVMIWNDCFLDDNNCGTRTSFTGCLNDCTCDRSLFKKKRRREEEGNNVVRGIEERKTRKFMSLNEVESFLRE